MENHQVLTQLFPKIKSYWGEVNWLREINITEHVSYESVQESARLVLRKLLILLVMERDPVQNVVHAIFTWNNPIT